MVQNQAELDNIILESQDFPEVNVQKGASCFSEEFAYLVKSIFSGVKKDVRFFYESFREKGVPLERFSLYNIDKSQIILGEQAGGILVPAHVSTTYVKIKPAREIEFHIINKDSGIVPIRIEVYDKDFLESAKVFAKTYTKWCGQEATVTKEYNSTEEKAQEMIRLEGMIDKARKGKEETTNINELVEEPKVTLARSDEAMRKLREEKQETLLKEVKQKLEKIIKPKLEKGLHFGKCGCDAYFSDWEYGQMKIPLTVNEHKIIFKKQFAYGITVECDYIGFSNSNKVFCIELGIWSEKYLESATTLANKLKEEFDTHVKITQHY